jgi:hypothetical protein
LDLCFAEILWEWVDRGSILGLCSIWGVGGGLE